MKPSDKLLTFEPKGINRVIREASKRREYRLRTPQGSVLDRLVLEVMGTGHCAWRVVYDVRIGARRVRRKIKIGDHKNDISTVRERWRATLVRIEAGGDPLGEEQAQREIDAEREQMTFAKLVEDYLAAKEKAKRRSVDETRRILEKDALPDLGRRPAFEVTALDVERILERITDRGSPTAARACHVAIHGVFSWGLGVARWRAAGLTQNVAGQIRKAAPPAPRTRKLTNDQLQTFWRALASGNGLEPGTADAARLCLLLARRADEVLGAAWTEFELNGAGSLWRIPPVRTKNKREIVVPLSAPALSIIERRRTVNTAEARPSAYVFRGAFVDRDQPLTEGVLRTALRRLCSSGVIPGEPFSPHDLRRTCAHRAAEELDFDRETIEALLGHISGSVTDAHYTQASKLNRIRRLVEAWAAHLQNIIDGKPDSNVVPLRTHG